MNNSGEVEYNPLLQTAAEAQAPCLARFPPTGDGGRQASVGCSCRVTAVDRCSDHHKTRGQYWTFILFSVQFLSKCGNLMCAQLH